MHWTLGFILCAKITQSGKSIIRDSTITISIWSHVIIYKCPFYVFNTLGARNSLERIDSEGNISSQIKPFQIRKLDEKKDGRNVARKGNPGISVI